MRTKKTIVAAAIALVLGVFLADWLGTASVDGRFPVRIVVLDGGRPVPPVEVASVRYASLPSAARAPEQDAPAPDTLRAAEARDGGFRAWIPCAWQESLFGREHSYVQPESLYVHIALEEGRQVAVWCPTGRRGATSEVAIDLALPSADGP